MALVNCPDCGHAISDLAPHCIHCGRPGLSAADAGAGALTDRARQVASHVASSMHTRVASWSAKATAGVGTALRDLAGAVSAKLFEDREVIVFLLPTGAGAADFVSYLDLSETLDLLSRGRLVRPRLTVWAHRSDVDKERLAAELEQRFSQEVAAFRSRQLAEQQAATHQVVAKAGAEREDAGKKAGQSATVGVAAVLAMAVFTNPLLHLLLLVIAVTSGADTVLEMVRKAGAQTERSRASRAGDVRARELREEAQHKQAAFRKALANVELRIHHQLAALASDYSHLDDDVFVPEPVEQGPDAIPLLRDVTYRGAVPTWYFPLLDSRIETWTQS